MLPVQEDKSPSLQVLGASSLAIRCETWTLTSDLRQRLNSFGSRSLRRILGYHWLDFVSNEWLLRETQIKFVTCIVRERQLQLYGHVARFPDADPAHPILSAREPGDWRRPTADHVPCGCSRLISILSRWGWAGQLPAEYWRKVDVATRYSGTCSHT